MSQSKVLIIGAGGQLGKAFAQQFPDAYLTTRQELDIEDEESLNSFNWSEFDVIINAAAYTKVDDAESSVGRVESWKSNATAVGKLAKVASLHEKILIHISSEYVFDGAQEIYDENAPYSPLGVYGQSKAAGDIAASVVERHYILRTTWLIGDGKNFVRTMQTLADKNISPTVVSDQVGRLSFTTTVAAAAKHLLDGSHPYGTYNVTASGEPVSWAGVTREIFSLLERNDLTVSDISTEDYFQNKPGTAPRPLSSTLDLKKIEATGFQPETWKTQLKKYLKEEY